MCSEDTLEKKFLFISGICLIYWNGLILFRHNIQENNDQEGGGGGGVANKRAINSVFKGTLEAHAIFYG